MSIFGPKREEVVEGLEKTTLWGASKLVHFTKYYYADQVKWMSCVGHVARMRAEKFLQYFGKKNW